MDNRQREPGITIWLAVTAVCLALAYPLLFPFALRFAGQTSKPAGVAMLTLRFYRPLLRSAYNGQWPLKQYADCCGVNRNRLLRMVKALAVNDMQREELRRTASSVPE